MLKGGVMLTKTRLMVIISCILFSQVVFSGSAQGASWSRTYGGTVGDWADAAGAAQQTSDGGYIVVGETTSFGSGDFDIWLLKLNADGNVVWQKTYGTTGTDYSSSVQQTSDGGYIVVGGTTSFGVVMHNIWLLKLDADGNVVWQKTYGGAGIDYASSVQQTSDQGYIVAGGTESFGAGNRDIWLLKLDAAGNVAWEKTYGGTGTDEANSVQQTSDQGYIVAGRTESFGAGNRDIWLLKLDAAGNVAWEKTYGGTGSDYAQFVRQTADMGYIVAAATSYSFGSTSDVWLIKLDGSGSITWQKTYGGEGGERPYSVQQTSDGGYIVAGDTTSFSAIDYDRWLLKLSGNGSVTWQKTYGGPGDDFAYGVQQTTDGGYIVVGETTSFGAGSYDIWLLKVENDGSLADCPLGKVTNATVTDTAVSGITSTATVTVTTASVGNTTVTPGDTTMAPLQICPAVLSVVSPNGEEDLITASDWEISWTPYIRASSFKLSYSLDQGATWKLIKKGITGTSTTWTTPLLTKNKTKCLVKVVGFNDKGKKVGADKSDSPFTIEVFTITSPNGGETVHSGIPLTVTWVNHVTAATTASLFYTLNNGLTWKKIPEDIDLSIWPASYEWTPPVVSKEKSRCKLKLVLKDAIGMKVGTDKSDGTFKIAP